MPRRFPYSLQTTLLVSNELFSNTVEIGPKAFGSCDKWLCSKYLDITLFIPGKEYLRHLQKPDTDSLHGTTKSNGNSKRCYLIRDIG
jgi:hypothetical protein